MRVKITLACTECKPVSYTHLDVYKRQIRKRIRLIFIHALPVHFGETIALSFLK